MNPPIKPRPCITNILLFLCVAGCLPWYRWQVASILKNFVQTLSQTKGTDLSTFPDPLFALILSLSSFFQCFGWSRSLCRRCAWCGSARTTSPDAKASRLRTKMWYWVSEMAKKKMPAYISSVLKAVDWDRCRGKSGFVTKDEKGARSFLNNSQLRLLLLSRDQTGLFAV